ncbi:MAG: hypothetical protein WC828_00025 [Thermoleophilia bacterium]|jgi:hypothetical protein
MKKLLLFCALQAVLVIIITGCGSSGTTTVTQVETVTTSGGGSSTAAQVISKNPDGTNNLGNFSGKGNQMTQKFHLSPGLYRFSYKYGGKHNFIISLEDSSGITVDSIVNIVGAVDSSKAIRIKQEGDYLLDVEAWDAWTITVKPEN